VQLLFVLVAARNVCRRACILPCTHGTVRKRALVARFMMLTRMMLTRMLLARMVLVLMIRSLFKLDPSVL
jgi:hypothetical protein